MRVAGGQLQLTAQSKSIPILIKLLSEKENMTNGQIGNKVEHFKNAFRVIITLNDHLKVDSRFET